MSKKPALAQFGAFQNAYDYFNRVLFGDSLKPCMLNFRGKGKRNLGLFWPRKWTNGDGTTHEIALNPDVLTRPLEDTLSTLVHEMCHQWQEDFGKSSRAGYHNREWGNKMKEVGLHPSNTGEPGGKETGQQMTHYVIAGGRFEQAIASMPEEVKLPWISGVLPEATKKSPSRNKIKYVCSCGVNVWGKGELNIVCGECGEDFAREEP